MNQQAQTRSHLSVVVNGTALDVADEDVNIPLLQWLRGKAVTKGVKQACGEGGCGACAVLVESQLNGVTTFKSVNSCLMPVYALDGQSIKTAEGLPCTPDGRNPVAERLAGFHASQCGFCTPGMAVACHTALSKAAAAGKAPSAADMRDALDGNLCRCTGYRPIIDACKSFAEVDIEDLGLNAFTSQGKPLPAPAVLPQPAEGDVAPAAGPRAFTLRGGQTLFVPISLEELLQEVSSCRVGSVRLVAGHTGVGVYKDWPDQPHLVHITKVPELQGIAVCDIPEAGGPAVRLGAAVTLAEAISTFKSWTEAEETGTAGGKQVGELGVWQAMASHLSRVAGSHVRSAATLVGNLVLTRTKGLPSDVATLLMAAGALIEVVDARQAGRPHVLQPLHAFLAQTQQGQGSSLSNSLVVIAVLVPVPQAGSRYWSSRIAARYANSAAIINVAAMLPPREGGQPTFVLGMDLNPSPGAESWVVSHCTQVEASLKQVQDHPADVAAAATQLLPALYDDLHTIFHLPVPSATANGSAGSNGKAPVTAEAQQHLHYLRSTAEGLLLQALTACLSRQPDLPQHLPAPAVCQGHQDLVPPDLTMAPLTQALPKESALLQASGTAQYADDIPITQGALYAALVTSKVAKGTVRAVDYSAALKVPGAVRFIGPQDLKKSALPGDEPVFATDVEYHGQPIGMILGDSYHSAQQAAQLVQVQYDEPQDGPAVLTLYQAIEQGSVYDVSKMMTHMPPGASKGSIVIGKSAADVDAAIAGCTHQIRGATRHLPSQGHMYMEPQTTVAEVDEDGCVRVTCSTQHIDSAMIEVARQLDLSHNKVECRTRRLGGGFGGKAKNPERFAVAAAVAAVATGKQVRLAVNRNTDMAMIGGRCAMRITYDVGFDASGRVKAVKMICFLEGGAYRNLSVLDIGGFKSTVDNVYHLPHLHVEMSLMRLNLPGRTAVRGPGDFMSVLAMESVMDHVALQLGLDGSVVREVNMRPAVADDQGYLCSSIGMKLGEVEHYTLPRIWQELKASSGYDARVKAVADWNASHTWVKRGLSINPCMYPLGGSSRAAAVHIYADGSVLVVYPGSEMGQGLSVKCLQTAAYELSQLLPEARRPIPLDLLRPADRSTYSLPHYGLTGGSTTSDGACTAVRAACAELVQRLTPIAAQLGEDFTWQQLIAKAAPAPGMAPRVTLSAIAHDSMEHALVGKPIGPWYMYTTYGAAVAEVEVDVLTGDRRVLAVDLLFDCGKTLNPAVDLGQVEGAFIFGMGLVLSEHVEADSDTGACTTNSTWSYKVPGALCVPQRFNVSMLKDSPMISKGPLAAKAVGEPPLLLAASVMSALNAATAAAAQQVFGAAGCAQDLPLALPATPQAVKQACGTLPLGPLVKQLMHNARMNGVLLA